MGAMNLPISTVKLPWADSFVDPRARYYDAIAREKEAGGPIPMFEGWTCQACGLTGRIEVGSRAKHSETLRRISLQHRAKSPTCDISLAVTEPWLEHWVRDSVRKVWKQYEETP